ncbi:putative polysaccharide biosynthesis protein [Paenibacillus pasadenensis]|uniref:Stage V sporulation protein B n=1 Tax=Paenibacillus pasadenensis TaxID=217090 RepID=A0A2N5NAD4_9BACL|nr:MULTISPECIES: polysaccharide biosynthesis protein [Paenibacillus]PLT47275.1 Stage V sporulation protein B [Paenibacillus pasadenensis]QGG57575.1 oligosaccharide flippase family protein [Paenibacillus sp. B01]
MVKKDSLIRGTLILAAAALIARVLGVFQKVPLDYLFTGGGSGYLGIANNVYLYLLVIATAGIPSAISKMVSERYAIGRPDEAQRIYRAGLLFGVVTGVTLAVALWALAPWYAEHIAKSPGAAASVRAIAPALILFPVIAMMRGYFQGRQMMSAGGISQIVEQIARVLLGVALAVAVFNLGWGDTWVSAAATFGSVFGSIGAFLVMLYYARKLKRSDLEERLAAGAEAAAASAAETGRRSAPPMRLKAIYKEMFAMSIPVVVTAMTVQFIYLVDASFFIRWTDGFFASEAAAEQVRNYLIYNGQSIAGIPPILAIALSQSILPVLSAANSVGRLDEVQRQASLVMRIVVFTGVPAALLLTVAAHSVNGLLFVDPAASGMVAALTVGTIFQITMMTSNSILFGLGTPRPAMISTLIGYAVKIVGSLLLGPLLGGYGFVLASMLCFMVITSLNLLAIRQKVRLQVLGKRWTPYLAAVLITAAAGFGTDMTVRGMLGTALHAKLVFLAGAIATSLVCGFFYLFLLIALGVIREADAKSFPGPLRKLLLPLVRRLGRREGQASAGL